MRKKIIVVGYMFLASIIITIILALPVLKETSEGLERYEAKLESENITVDDIGPVELITDTIEEIYGN